MPKPVFIPLAAGVQSELADQLVQPGATLALENCASPQTGITEMRLGADVLSTPNQATIPDSGALPIPWQLAALEGSLVRFNRSPEPLHVWAPSPQAWVRHAPSSGGILSFRRGPIKVDTSAVFSGAESGQQVQIPQVAVGTNAIVETWEDTGAGVVVAILDRVTRKALTFTRTANGRAPRVVIVGNRAVVAYWNGSTGFLQVDAYDLTTYALVQQQTMGAVWNSATDTAFDMRVGAPGAASPNVGILYRESAAAKLRCAVLNATNLAVNSTFAPRTTAGVEVQPNLAFGWMQDFGASGKFAIMIADTTNGLRTLWDLPAPAAGLSNATATHVLDAGATAAPSGPTAGIRNVIGTTTANLGTGLYRVLYEVTAPSATTKAKIKVALWTGAATLDVQFRSVALRSKLWKQSTNFYFLAAFDGADQRSYFVCAVANDLIATASTPPAPLAVVFPRDAAGLTEFTNGVADAAVGPDGAIYLAATSEVRTESITFGGSATGTTQRLFAAEVVRIRHPATAETEVGEPVTFLKSLFVPDGLLGHFDGYTFATAGFPCYPSAPTATIGTAGGNLTPSSNYAWRFTFAFADRNGREWESAPSAAITGATDGTKFKFTIVIDTLRLIDHGFVDGTFGYRIKAYRTQANAPGAYFLVATVANDPLNDTVTFTDNVADTALGTELYTDGNGAENQLLPPISNVAVFGGRLICAQAGTGTFWYCVETDFDHGLIFNEALTFDVDDPTDPITGLAVDGQHLFVFKEGKVYIVGGEGANALGQGQTYNFRLIDSDTGCSNPQSIVAGAEGVWYRSSTSRAGIFRTTGGVPEYVGAGVHAYNGLTITSAVVMKDKTEIRWYTLEGTTLIWDWTSKLWKTNTGQVCLTAATGYGTGVVYSAADGTIMSEATATSVKPYLEGAATYFGRLRSPWYQAGIDGWQRIKRIHGIGKMSANRQNTTRVILYKDLDDTTPIQVATFSIDDNRKHWDWEIRPAQQKCTAMMIEVLILPFQPANEIIAVGTDTYNGIDVDTGFGSWTFQHGAFSAGDVGGVVVIVGSGKAGTYTIKVANSPTTVLMTPIPGGGTGAFVATSITFTPPPQYTAGPQILGVSLIPVAKEGAQKLPASRRA